MKASHEQYTDAKTGLAHKLTWARATRQLGRVVSGATDPSFFGRMSHASVEQSEGGRITVDERRRGRTVRSVLTFSRDEDQGHIAYIGLKRTESDRDGGYREINTIEMIPGATLYKGLGYGALLGVIKHAPTPETVHVDPQQTTPLPEVFPTELSVPLQDF